MSNPEQLGHTWSHFARILADGQLLQYALHPPSEFVVRSILWLQHLLISVQCHIAGALLANSVQWLCGCSAVAYGRVPDKHPLTNKRPCTAFQGPMLQLLCKSMQSLGRVIAHTYECYIIHISTITFSTKKYSITFYSQSHIDAVLQA